MDFHLFYVKAFKVIVYTLKNGLWVVLRAIKSAADLRKCYDSIHPENLKMKEKIKNM